MSELEEAFEFLKSEMIESAIDSDDEAYSLRVEKALQTIRASLQGWQPIETAPKDGTEILVAKHTDIYGFILGSSCWFEDELIGGGWLSIGLQQINGQRIDLGLADPTHWMPLPKPPKET